MSSMTVQLILQAIDKATAPIAAVGRALDKVGEVPRAVAASLGKLGQDVGLANVAARARVAGDALGQVGMAAAGAGLKLAALAGLGGGGLLGLTRATANYSEQILMLSEKTGIATDTFQQLAFAAEQSSVGPEAFADSMKFLNRNIASALTGSAEAEEAFRSAGISIRDSSGNVKTADAIFLELSEAFKGSTNAAAKTQIAMALLGRAGSDMIPLLNSGSGSIKELMEKAAKLGLVLDEKTIKAAEAFGDKLSQLWQVVKMTGIAIGGALIPYVEPLVDRFIELSAALSPIVTAKIAAWFESLGDVVPVVLDGLGQFWDVLQQVGSAIAWVGDTFGYGTTIAVALGAVVAGPLVVAFANLALASTLLGSSLVSMIAKLGALVVMPAAAAIGALFTAIRSGMGVMAAFNLVLAANPIGLLIVGIAALAAAATAIYVYWGPISKFFADQWANIVGFASNADSQISAVLDGMGTSIKSALGGALEWLGNLFDATFGRIVAGFKGLTSMLPDSVRKSLGLSAAAPAQALTAAQAPAASLSANGGSLRETVNRAQAIDGQIVIRLEGDTDRARVERMQSSGGVDLGLDLGHTMAMP
ncbi:MAG: hypothetical protein ACK5XB_19450 [Rhodospirillales bacterium]|jgi:hypothetical protein